MARRSDYNRRDFLRTTAAVTAATAAGGVWSELAAQESVSPNEKLNIACVGTANRAAADIDGVKGEAITVLCDVDKNYLDRALAQFPGARTYADSREMLEQEADKIDAVVVATADHTHAPTSIRAIRKGLHCYCEKPLTHTVHEARLVAEAAKEHGVATQLGTQIHAGENYRRVVEIVQAGTIGDITDVHVWVGKGWGGGERPEGGEDPPATLSWDLWLGPAPERPYVAGRYHPAQWRRWWDFGQGTLGDMACHYMDLPFWALKLRHPTHCEAEGPDVHPETCPNGLIVRYKYPERDGLVPVNLTWYDGDLIPKQVEGERVPNSGVMFVGTEGKMFADYGSYRLFPQEKFKGFEPPAPTIARSIGHHAEWIKACKDGSPTTCNFDYSGALTEAVLLGNVAYRVGQPLQWDAKSLKATNCPAAEQYIRKEYRPGWEVA
ncbi:MAG: Gfo/Idh/MocA family oxidoreductase [Planctomycetaceae bacterium]|nr:Gfo/Idh/MocA family oxidoreductase [Planctomycetales bacterium]MCB9923332.1 Gfo/Idh/MocA family oxidoreductase [Planctomycetaceae bacterium]